MALVAARRNRDENAPATDGLGQRIRSEAFVDVTPERLAEAGFTGGLARSFPLARRDRARIQAETVYTEIEPESVRPETFAVATSGWS